MREIFEETGLRRVRFLTGFRETLTYFVHKKGKSPSPKQVVLFLAEMGPEDEILLSDEHSEVCDATLPELEQLIRHEDLKSLFRRAQAYLDAHPILPE